MNKKFLNVFLFSALMLGTAGTFTSCKDYDDDITNLQGQLDELASASELKASVSDMNAAISQAKSEAEAKAAAAQSVADAAKAAAAQAQTSADAAQAAIDAANAKVAELEANGATKAAVEAAQEAADAAAAAASAADAKGEAAAAAAQAAADAAQDAADAAAENLAKINALDTRLTALETKVNGMSNEAIEADLSALSKEVAALKADLEALIGEYSTMVTSVSLYAFSYTPSTYINIDGGEVTGSGNVTGTADASGNVSGTADFNGWILWGYGSTGEVMNVCGLDFVKATEKTTKFGPNNEVVFQEGKIKTYTDSLVIRVSPTNAILNKENISLINTLGEDLNEFVTVEEVKPFEELLTGSSRLATRAASPNNGLWKVTFKLKDNYKVEDLAAAIEKPYNNNSQYAEAIRFAVAINNTETAEDAAERRVVSTYDVEVSAKEARALGTLNFTASNDAGEDVSITNIRNRYRSTEDGTSTATIEELIWANSSKPAIAENIIKEGNDANVRSNVGTNATTTDNRQYRPFLPVIKGQPINIKFDERYPIKAFYVTLDSKRAIESGNSEINAWNSYKVDNLNTVQYGNTGSITIQDINNVAGDIIGFRIYAVNLDGTLLDPDGRAFYVSIGNVKETGLVQGSINAANAQSDFIALEEGFFAGIASEISSWSTTTKTGEGVYNYTRDFKYEFYKADKRTVVSGSDLKDAAYVVFKWNGSAADYEDNQTYTQVVTFKNANGNILTELTMEMTKVMPTDFPSWFSAKANQIIDGVYTCYLQPSTTSWEVGTTATSGYMDLASAFNGLDRQHIEFSFANSDKDGKAVKATYNGGTDSYRLTIAANLINGTTQHATTVSYVYQRISTTMKADGTPNIGQNYPVDWSTKFNTVYACWHSASSWGWNNDKTSGAKAADKSITYAATGKTVNTAVILATNSYNNSVFGGSLSKFLTGSGTQYLKLVAGKSKLVSNSTGVEDYFDVQENVTTGTLTFVPLKDDIQSNPKANVASTLTIVCEDCYGHEVTISLDFTVTKQ